MAGRVMHESAEHAALVELFRHHPELATALAERCGVATPSNCRARVGDPVQKPATLAPDVAIELLDAQGVRRMVLLIEVQRRVDEEKLLSWPAYLWFEWLRRVG